MFRLGRTLAFASMTVVALSGAACSGAPEEDGEAETSRSTATSDPPSSPPPTVRPLPFDARGLLGGDARPIFPAGSPGEVSVVAVGPVERSIIDDVDTTVTQPGDPAWLAPGEVGLAVAFFSDHGEDIPDEGATFDVDVTSVPVDDDGVVWAPLTVTASRRDAGRIVGTAVDRTGRQVVGDYLVQVYCFERGRLLADSPGDFVAADEVGSDGTVPFSVSLAGRTCPTYVVGVSGRIP